MDFQEFPKIARLARDIVVTEKIDGTNAQIHIVSPENPEDVYGPWDKAVAANRELGVVMFAGSRTQWITPDRDNFGFAAWVKNNADALWPLGEGRHYGEWWGSGIQRGYGLTKGEKRFSLFNVASWHAAGAEPYVLQGADPRQPPRLSQEAPACCGVVPVLYRGPFSQADIDACVDDLRIDGSHAAPGFRNPEGVIVFHTASGTYYKRTLEKDEQPKGRS